MRCCCELIVCFVSYPQPGLRGWNEFGCIDWGIGSSTKVVVILLLVVVVVMYSAREVVEINSFVPQKMCCCRCLICLANSFEKNSSLIPK